MSTLARTVPPATGESQLLTGLHRALAGFSKDLAAQLVVLLQAQPGAAKSSRKTVERAMVESVPGLLERAFVINFLSGEAQAREHRALLSHLLTAAELRATVGNDWSALLQATVAATAAASSDDDDELTSEDAAKLLHVSRTHVNSLADSGVLGVVRRTDGGHRRISKAALLKYKALSRQRQAKGLETMVAASQKLELYDAELEGIPVKGSR